MFRKTLLTTLRFLSNHKTIPRFSSSDSFNKSRMKYGVPDIDITGYEENNKNNVDIKLLKSLQEKLKNETHEVEQNGLVKGLLIECNKIANTPHQDIVNYNEQPKIIKTVQNNDHNFKLKELDELGRMLKGIKSQDISMFTGQRSYYFIGDIAELEHALVKYTLETLKQKNFKLVSVPDILPSHVIERCGMNTTGNRNQIYYLDGRHGEELCLSGTAEMAMGGYLHDTTFDYQELPVLLTSCSRCYRAEVSAISEEKGIYRVHHFTKVEMFAVTTQETSNQQLEEFLKIQEQHFSSLGLDYQILDMPQCELGSPASRKYDIEAWLPGRNMFGEISSCSNCTDYQSKRLNIKYKDKNGEVKHAHTINGTACAIPRLIIAILETYQQADGVVAVPTVLQPYLTRKQVLKKQTNVPKIKQMKTRK